MMDIGVVIAAKGNSVRVPNKNIRPFGDSSLLEHKLLQLQQLEGVKNIYVNSDCDTILNVASQNGAKVIKRDSTYCTDKVSINEVYKNVVEDVPHEHIMFIHITSPLVKLKSLQDCIDTYINLPKEYDSLATVTAMHKFLWYGDKSINYDPKNMPRSQDLPPYYVLNFAVNILPRSYIIESKNIIGDNFLPYYLDDVESFDVDTMVEFNIAEQLLKVNL